MMAMAALLLASYHLTRLCRLSAISIVMAISIFSLPAVPEIRQSSLVMARAAFCIHRLAVLVSINRTPLSLALTLIVMGLQTLSASSVSTPEMVMAGLVIRARSLLIQSIP